VAQLHLLLTFLVGWLQHEQHEVIQYLREENRVLKARRRYQRVRFTDDERRRLAALGACPYRKLGTGCDLLQLGPRPRECRAGLRSR
jgi:hypothetical protein